jgi:benzodiazapine receptor
MIDSSSVNQYYRLRHPRSEQDLLSRYENNRKYFLPVMNLVLFTILIVCNILAIGEIFGRSIMDVAFKYKTRFSPADYSLVVLCLIYLCVALWIVTHWIIGIFKREDNELFNMRVGTLFSFSCVLHSLWIVTYVFEKLIPASMFMTMLLVVCLVMYYRLDINYGLKGQQQQLQKEYSGSWEEFMGSEMRPITRWEFWINYAPYSMYLAYSLFQTCNCWISTIFAHYPKGEMNPVGQTTSILVQCIITVLALSIMAKRKDFVFPLVTVWYFIGIAVQQFHSSTAGLIVAVASLLLSGIIACSVLCVISYLLIDYSRRYGYSSSREESSRIYNSEAYNITTIA